MKVRDSGMPEEAVWDTYFDAGKILETLAFTDSKAAVVDFGCGYGTFTVAAARMTSGPVYALDIDGAMTDATAARAADRGLGNVKTIVRDFVAEGTGLPDESIDYAMLFNIVHAENPGNLLDEAFRVLRPGGKAAVIHWIHDAATPRGPDLSIRPRPGDCRRWMAKTGFDLLLRQVSLPPYHFGLVGRVPSTSQSHRKVTANDFGDRRDYEKSEGLQNQHAISPIVRGDRSDAIVLARSRANQDGQHERNRRVPRKQ